MIRCLLIFAAASLALAQNAEQAELNKLVADTQGSPIDLIRGLDRHLAKYPMSPQRAPGRSRNSQ